MNDLVEIIKLKNLKEPFKYLIAIGLIFVLPQNMVTFLFVCTVLILFTINKPKRVLYISTAIISFRYYFSDTSDIQGSGLVLYFWKHLPLSATFVANSHNFIFIYLLIAILFQLGKKEVIIKEFNKIIVLSLSILLITIISGLFHSTGFMKIILFIVQFFRPILFFLLIIIIEWEEKEIFDYFKFILLIIFPMQIVLTIFDNVGKFITGNVLIYDYFTGSFCFPFNWITVQVMFYSLFIISAEYIIKKQQKVLFFILILVFSIISAQSGMQTAVILFFSIPFILRLLISPGTIGLNMLQTNFIVGIVFAFVISLILSIFFMPDIEGYDSVVTYNVNMTEGIFQDVGILETPKVRIYQIFFDQIANGEINPLIGLGPGEYLSGASLGSEKSYTANLVSNPLYFTSKYVGNMTSLPNNNFVGVTGEIGIIGYILFFLIYALPYKYIMRNRYHYFNTFWHPVFIGFLGISFALLGWSFFWNAIEDFATPVYFWMIAGVLLIVSENKSRNKT